MNKIYNSVKITDISVRDFFIKKIEGQKKSKKLLTFTDLCAIITTEGQRKSKTNTKI